MSNDDDSSTPASATFPVVFVSHGAPLLALDTNKGAEFEAFSRAMPTPKAVLVFSAHWETDRPTLGTVETRPLLYDFSGFPQELYRLTYPAKGAPTLAARVQDLLRDKVNVDQKPERGLDHGVWVPLFHMYRRADVPILQVGFPRRARATALFDLGRALAPLRDEGVLILTSGGMVHNLSRIDLHSHAKPPSWAVEFDAFCAEALAAGDIDALLDFDRRAPAPRTAHPTLEHFFPLFIALGAASEGPKEVRFPIEGFEYGSLSRRAVQFG